MVVDDVTPECRIRFDSLEGEPRNADLAFVGHTPAGVVAVTIEAKADETFGETVANALSSALERVLKSATSPVIRRR